VSALRLPRPVLDTSFRQLRECGAGRAECVVYWCAALDQPDLLTRVVHPVHHAGYARYEVDSAWVTEFFLDLRRARQTVLVQVHTHPREAGHSWTDDQFALVPAADFLSLVIPCFAAGPAGLADTALVRMQPDGTWAPADPEEVFRIGQ
jgi:hypothetical protein